VPVELARLVERGFVDVRVAGDLAQVLAVGVDQGC
jgi:hypothetical protein